jgi:hypothetical protein
LADSGGVGVVFFGIGKTKREHRGFLLGKWMEALEGMGMGLELGEIVVKG